MRKSTRTICIIMMIALIIAMTPTAFAVTNEYAYIRIEGYEDTLVEKTAVPLEIFSLDSYGISDNPQHYSVLHAIIYALEAKGYDATKKDILNTNGGSYISSVLGLTAQGNAGWMYVLNDNSSWNSIKDQQISKGDYVVIYYIEDWMSCSYSTFGLSDEYETDAFTTVKLNLKHQVTNPVTWEVSYENVSDAVITIDGQKTNIVTDKSGNAYITFKDWGIHTISAEKYVDGINTISRPYASVKTYGKGVAVNIYTKDKTYTAYMDPKGFDLSKYNVSSELDFSALHAVIRALSQNGFDAADPEDANFNKGSFISLLAGVEATGNASWMYAVNNESSWYALNEQPLKDGDILDVYLLNDWMTDTYAFFDISNIKAKGGEKINIRLYRHVLDYSTWEVSVLPYAGCEITINGQKAGYVTDEEGFVTVSFNKKGIYELSTLPKEDNISKTSVYIDVISDKLLNTEEYIDYEDVSDEYSAYVTKAMEQYILTGDQDKKLRPMDEVTKAEFHAMLIRAAGLEIAGKYRKKYTDIASGHWFAGYAQTVFKYGLATHDKGYFNPNDSVNSDSAQYALKKVFESDLELTETQNALFFEGLTREEAILLILSYMEAVAR